MSLDENEADAAKLSAEENAMAEGPTMEGQPRERGAVAPCALSNTPAFGGRETQDILKIISFVNHS